MERWHLPLVAAGVATGLVCTVAPVLWQRWREGGLRLTAVAAMVVVVLVNETSSWWGVVAVLAAALTMERGPRAFWVGSAAVVAATALAVESYPTEVRLAALTIMVMAAGIEAMNHRHPLAGSPGGILVLLAAPVLTWVCVPDTEAVVVVGTAVGVVLVVALATDRARPVEGQFPFLVLLTLATADGFRGRPAGIAASWVIMATVVGWPVAALIRRRLLGDGSELFAPLFGTAVVVIIAALVARTAGLSWDVERSAAVGGAATVAVLVVCALLLRAASTTQAGGGTEGQAVPTSEDRSGPGQGRERVQPEP